MDSYVIDDFKSLETKLIPSDARAVELWQMFSQSPRRFEILLWCSGPDVPEISDLESFGSICVPLGFEVSTLGSYWSIAEDMPTAPWTNRYRAKLNDFGLFRDRNTAEQYLDEYKAQKSAEWDMEFQVGYVLDVKPAGEQ